MNTAKTLDGILMCLVSGDVCDRAGVTQYRGALSKVPAEHTRRAADLFAAIPRLTYAQIPGAVKRLRAGKTAIDERAAKVAQFQADVAAGIVERSHPVGEIVRRRHQHQVVCRSRACKICN